MAWSGQQEQAIKAVRAWIGNRSAPQVFRLFGFAGTGKAQPLDAIVQTPTGPRAMGDLAVGDLVLTINGKPTRVLGVYPQGVKPIYRVTFRDGASTRCCGDHLWAVTNGGYERRKMPRMVISTKDLIERGLRFPSGDRRWRIPLTAPVEYDMPAAPFDPYTIGALIGDAHLTGNVIELACDDSEIVERIRAALPEGFEISSRDCGTCPHHIIKDTTSAHWNRLRVHLDAMGLIAGGRQKRIPDAYLLAPVADRIDLLRGLMDTDGSVRMANSVNFTTTSPGLAKDVATLVQSLGGTAITKFYERRASAEYQINVKLGICPFYLPRKAERWRASEKNPPSRFIEAIDLIGEAEAQCIAVDNADHLYLTDDFIATHNTKLARELAASVKGQVCFGAFTGKAALMMRKKGCADATTIHAMIYKIDDNGSTYQPRFELKHDAPARDAKLIVIDECSMVDEQLARDLMSFGKKILVIGDPAQLPPVKGTGFFTDAEPDFMLTEVHRQARDNPIIAMSMTIREGGRLEIGQYGSSRVISRADVNSEIVLGADQVIVGLNKTRVGYNRRIRGLRGFESPMPLVGDRLVCLKNNREKKLLNGGLWNVDSFDGAVGEGLRMVVRPEDADPETKGTDISVLPEFFTGDEANIPWERLRNFDQFTFGYALTCHKSQGSQWGNVVVFDEASSFREDAARWRYTAVTRAAERVIVVQ